MVKVAKDKYLYTNNGSYQLTDEDIQKMKDEGTPLQIVQSRIDAGWDVKDAIRLNKRYVIKDGQFKARIAASGKVAFLSEEAIDDMKEQGLSFRDLDSRLRVSTNLIKDVDEHYDRALIRLAKEDREREERRKAREDAKQRKEQERLQMIEDAKCRDPYWFDNTWNQMFKGWS
ncbi:SA1788 family PVL leukocidin-associated protein [Staphylococcus saprophyticus]|nr:SA1788 family PVL leukocidin-associated protein [Staphylococcus saprophyticus]MDW4150255.1 SA1788 family PVL leukocidin-associated protein [Staphylococcus saprophyticus]